MRDPPRKLSIDDASWNPNCSNVRIFVRGKEIKNVIEYDAEEGTMTIYTGGFTGNYEFEEATFGFDPGDFRVEWIDVSRVEIDYKIQQAYSLLRN